MTWLFELVRVLHIINAHFNLADILVTSHWDIFFSNCGNGLTSYQSDISSTEGSSLFSKLDLVPQEDIVV